MNRLPVFVLLMGLFSLPSFAADLSPPLPTRNFYPPIMRFFDPTPDSALRAFDQAWTIEVNQHFSTMNSFDVYPNSILLADMELYIFDPVLRRSFSDDFELSVRAPVLRPYNGAFDSLIQAFHRTISMPNGGRQLRPNNQFAYSFDNRQGATWQGKSRWEWGNVELSGRYQLAESNGLAIAALGAVKLPTASKARGWGSGASDLGAGMVASWRHNGWFNHLEAWLIKPLAKDDQGIQYVSYLRGSAAYGYEFSDVSVIIQAQGGSSPYRGTHLSWLENPPLLIDFGMRGQMQPGIGWSFTVTENITQRTTQDVSVSVGLSLTL